MHMQYARDRNFYITTDENTNTFSNVTNKDMHTYKYIHENEQIVKMCTAQVIPL